MREAANFEAQLAAALTRYAELGPVLDTGESVRFALEGRSPRAIGLGRLWQVGRVPRSSVRLAYLLLMIALLLAALYAVVLIGSKRPNLVIPLGRNGAIAFYVQGYDHSGNRAYVLNADGSTLGDAGYLCPVFSADGSAVAYRAGDAPSLFVANADGSSPRELPQIVEPGLSLARTFALSPDGEFVAWFKDDELRVVPTNGDQPRTLLAAQRAPYERRVMPSWSPDGARIAFLTTRTDPVTLAYERTSVHVVDVDDGELHLISSRRAIYGEEHPSWSPDGRFVTYSASPQGAAATGGVDTPHDVFVAAADGSDELNLTNSSAHEAQPQFSPDGLELAFLLALSDESYRLVTLPVQEGSASGPQVEGPETPWFVWAPDSTELLWQETSADGSGNPSASLMSIARDFRGPSTTLISVQAGFVCPPSWQRLEP